MAPTNHRRSQQRAQIWVDLLNWELINSRPKLVVIMGRQTRLLIDHLVAINKLKLPATEQLTHYAYIGQRAQGKLGPMHPERILAYDQEFTGFERSLTKCDKYH